VRGVFESVRYALRGAQRGDNSRPERQDTLVDKEQEVIVEWNKRKSLDGVGILVNSLEINVVGWCWTLMARNLKLGGHRKALHRTCLIIACGNEE
jgi:hypothetical protein